MGGADLLVHPAGRRCDLERLRDACRPEAGSNRFVMEVGRLVLPGTEASITVRSMDLAGLAHGMLTVVDGRTPRDPGEVAISAAVARLANVGIGDPVNVKGLASPTVVGIVEDHFDLKARVVLQDVSAAEAAQAQGGATWLVGLPPGADATGFDPGAAPTTNGPAFQITSRDRATVQNEAPSVAIVVLGGLALVEAALVASAAFAVSIRRRQRELGLLAATGAEPRHLAGTVIAEGVLLGAVGALAGAIVGLAGALLASAWLDQLTDRRNPPVGIAPALLVVACGIGILAVLIAAIVPAWTASRSPVLTALSGRRPAQTPARRTFGLGVVLIVVAIALTGIGATLLHDPRMATLGLFPALAGAVLGTLGFGACSPWLLERLERPAAACHSRHGSRCATRHAPDPATGRSSPPYLRASPRPSHSPRSRPAWTPEMPPVGVPGFGPTRSTCRARASRRADPGLPRHSRRSLLRRSRALAATRERSGSEATATSQPQHSERDGRRR